MQRSTLMVWLLLLFMGFLVIYPLFMLLYGSFRGGPPGTPSPFTLQGYSEVYTDPGTFKTLWTTLWLAAVRVVLAICIAVFLAWVVTRTDTPWRRGLEVLIWAQFFLPTPPLVFSWMLLAAPSYGLLNQALMKVFGLSSPPLDIFSYGGIIWVTSVQWASLLFMIITPAFRGMDASLEESSRMAGASGQRTLLHVTLPLLSPAIVGAIMLAFIKLMETFEIELFLGFPKRIFVFSTYIWWLTSLNPPDYTKAMALSTLFLAVVFGLIVLQWKLLSRRQYVTITGRGYATRPIHLGHWKYVMLTIALLYILVSTILPVFGVVLGSFMRIFGIFVGKTFTFQQWRSAFLDPRLLSTIKNTVLVGTGAATAGMVLYCLTSYIVVKTKVSSRKALDFVSWLPWGVPAIVLSLGFLWAYVGGLRLPFMIYGTVWLLILVFLVRGLPLGVRVMNGAMVQVGNELEESSRVMGGTWAYTFRRVLVPILTPSFISAWVILFLLAVKDLASVALLYGPNSRVLSTMMLEQYIAGEMSKAMVVGVIMVALVLVFAVGARLFGSRWEVPT